MVAGQRFLPCRFARRKFESSAFVATLCAPGRVVCAPRSVRSFSAASQPASEWRSMSSLVALLLSLPIASRTLEAAFELAAHRALRRREAAGNKEPLLSWLGANLGNEFVQAHRVAEPLLLPCPAQLALSCCPEESLHAELALSLLRLFRSRLAWRTVALRQFHVALTWRGKLTPLSTQNETFCLDLPFALALSDDAFVSTVALLLGESDGAAAWGRSANAFAAAQGEGATVASPQRASARVVLQPHLQACPTARPDPRRQGAEPWRTEADAAVRFF